MILYRAVAEAEYQDWRATGRLRAKPGAMEGKHLTDTVEHALGFAWNVFIEPRLELGRMFILEVAIAPELEIQPYELRMDRVGPAYFLEGHELHFIRDVRLICRVEDER